MYEKNILEDEKDILESTWRKAYNEEGKKIITQQCPECGAWIRCVAPMTARERREYINEQLEILKKRSRQVENEIEKYTDKLNNLKERKDYQQ
jgi:hypothetical protein